ncbi:MAG: hypothetical protein HY301_01195 [Verrucomicrobia bacterium]|nr:hypothetical protein [Verrucomicrobiota bacterium]
MRLFRFLPFAALLTSLAFAQSNAPVLINKNFEGGSLGKVEKLGDAEFRLHVEGQCDERGRNRQASWHFFRMDNVAGRDLTLTLTDFVGEYNDKPGACPMYAETIPVFSYDGKTWTHFPAMDWDDKAKEATLKFHAESNTLWIAHIPPYTHGDLLRLLADVDRSPHARTEVIGKTVQGRDLHLVTVTDFSTPDDTKKTVWLQARQHAWEAGTSYVMEGALRFVTSDDPRAAELRRKVVFKFTPMMHPDGCANGWVRFNANGFDVNRHWDEVDLRDKEKLRLMPEIWYVKRAVFALLDSGRRIDLMINLHNTEVTEYVDTFADDDASQAMMQRLYTNLVKKTSFDPARKLGINKNPSNTTNSLYTERKVPVLLMEQRTGRSKKLGRQPTVADRLQFGRELIAVMAETVLP